MSFRVSNAGMDIVSAPLANAIVNKRSSTPTHIQSLAASNHSHPALFVVNSLPQILY